MQFYCKYLFIVLIANYITQNRIHTTNLQFLKKSFLKTLKGSVKKCYKTEDEKMLKHILQATPTLIGNELSRKTLHTTAALSKVQAGRYRITPKRDRPLTYEMANAPHHIVHRKSWNSWNTSTILDGIRPSQTAVEDVFIRKFMTGTWHSLVCSEVIIKRQYNHIRIAAIIRQGITARKMYFLIGYTEEMLSNWLQCPVTLELQTVADRKDVVFKYI